jgi:hypothetical protein
MEGPPPNDAFNAPPIENYVSHGAAVRRVYYHDAWGRDLLLVTFVYEPDKPPQLFISRRTGSHANPVPSSFHMTVPVDLWNSIVSPSDGIGDPPTPTPAPDSEIIVCADGIELILEATDGTAAGTRQRRTDSCVPERSFEYGETLARAAISLLSACSALPANPHAFAVKRLWVCTADIVSPSQARHEHEK